MRLQKHNKIRKGGAKSTRSMKGKARYHTIVGYFKDKSEAMKFEYQWKHINKRKTKSGLSNKMKRLLELLLDDKWYKINIKNLVLEGMRL